MTIKSNPASSPLGVPEWLVERLAAGDLPVDRAAEVRRRLELEPGGLERLARITESNREILEQHPPALAAVRVAERAAAAERGGSAAAERGGSAAAERGGSAAAERARAPRRMSRRQWSFTFATSAVAVGALALGLWLRPAPHSGGGDLVEHEGIKSPPHLSIYRKVGERVERLQEGAVARAGDRLQLAYWSGGFRFGAVASVDGAGNVTFHLPGAAGPAAGLSAKGEVSLADSYELDAAPGFERFVFVVGDKPFDAASLAAILRGTAPPPAGTKVSSLTVRKE